MMRGVMPTPGDLRGVSQAAPLHMGTHGLLPFCKVSFPLTGTGRLEDVA